MPLKYNVKTEEVIKKTDGIEQEIQSRLYEKFDAWVKYEILTWRWWLGVGLTIVPWIIFWYLFRKKPYFDRLLFVSSIIIMISVTLDTLGDQYGLWHYRYNTIAAVPTYFPWDFTLMPITISTFLLIKPQANPWLKAVFFALISSFIGEPAFHWLDVYVLDHWKYIYSVPIQIVIYLIAHWLYTARNKFSFPDNETG